MNVRAPAYANPGCAEVSPLRLKQGHKCVEEKMEQLQRSDEPSKDQFAMAIGLNTFKAFMDVRHEALKRAGNH